MAPHQSNAKPDVKGALKFLFSYMMLRVFCAGEFDQLDFLESHE